MPRWGEGGARGVDYAAVGVGSAALGVSGNRVRRAGAARERAAVDDLNRLTPQYNELEARMRAIRAARKAHKPVGHTRTKLKAIERMHMAAGMHMDAANAIRMKGRAQQVKGAKRMLLGAAMLPAYVGAKQVYRDLRPRKAPVRVDPGALKAAEKDAHAAAAARYRRTGPQVPNTSDKSRSERLSELRARLQRSRAKDDARDYSGAQADERSPWIMDRGWSATEAERKRAAERHHEGKGVYW